jgi:predicted naringenin-chalcone synthase
MTNDTTSAAILGIGTARPENRMSQDEAVGLAHEICCRSESERRLVKVLYRKAGVKERATCVPHQIALKWYSDAMELVGAEAGLATASVSGGLSTAASAGGVLEGVEEIIGDEPSGPTYLGPSTAERMRIYAECAPDMAVDASSKALADAGMKASEITHLVTVSCTGFFAPGLDLALINGLGLRPTVGRVFVGFMGCHGAINGLRTAQAIAAADPRNRVLLCAVEICSLHYSFQWDPNRAVGNAVFADGSAALVVAHQSVAKSDDGLQVAATGSCYIPDSGDAMSWNIGDNGFEMYLSPRVPDLIMQNLRPWFENWLAEQGLKIEDIGSWAVHPGGPRVLTAVEDSLGLDRTHTATSREVLAECGNMSSPTVLFILQRLRAAGAKMPCVALGFGPGLAAEAALFR